MTASDSFQDRTTNRIIIGLERAYADIELPSPRLIFGHLCKGDLEKPGVLRMSAIIGTKDGEDADIEAAFPGIGEHVGHDRAFQLHVERFGREKTLLNWLVCWARSFHDGSEGYVATASFLVSDDQRSDLEIEDNDGGTSIAVTMSREFLDALIPEELADKYLRTLYSKRSHVEPLDEVFGGRTACELELIAAKTTVWQRLERNSESRPLLQNLCSRYRAELASVVADREGKTGGVVGVPTDAEKLKFLSALQTAFAYVRCFGGRAISDGGGIVSVGGTADCSLRPEEATKVPMIPLMAISTSVSSASEATQYERRLTALLKAEPLSTVLQGIASTRADAVADSMNHGVCELTRFVPGIANLWQDTLTTRIPDPPFGALSYRAATWIAHLITWLHRSKHEGRVLEFMFVIGDMARIQDSPLFERLELRDTEFQYPPLPPKEIGADNNTVPRQRGRRLPNGAGASKMILNHAHNSLTKAQRMLEKENYFWFQNGRYALLWDLAFSEERPRYLLGLKDSSWHVFIEKSRNGQIPGAADSAVVVGYLDGRGGGGLIVGGVQTLSLSQDGQWVVRGDQLEAEIERYLIAASDESDDLLTSEEIDQLVRALVAMSNDPDSGCMLVLAKGEESCADFLNMGQPWKLAPIEQAPDSHTNDPDDREMLRTLSDEKIKAILGMDGAACVSKSNGGARIAFRKLVRPKTDESPRKACEATTSNMLGEGSRKWSAFLAAQRSDVALVVAVSHDGPVHFYTSLGVAKNAGFEPNCGCDDASTHDDDLIIHHKVETARQIEADEHRDNSGAGRS